MLEVFYFESGSLLSSNHGRTYSENRCSSVLDNREIITLMIFEHVVFTAYLETSLKAKNFDTDAMDF